MQITFPVWSDLGVEANTSTAMRDVWETELQHALRCYHYYSGHIFEEKVEDESVPEQMRPELFPIGVNLVKMMCLANADALFGEYDELPLRFAARRDLDIREADKAAIDLANNILLASSAHSFLWELALQREIFGGAAIRISPVLPKAKSKAHIKWSLVNKDSFYPVWDPDDPARILEAFIVTPLNADQAMARYGMEIPKGETLNRVEHWSESRIRVLFDGKEFSNQPNVWRIVPFEYIPRLRSTHWWGDALTDDLTDVQDELNMRLADIGEAMNYNAHPVRYGFNLPRSFDSDNFALDPSAMWDLGRTIGNSPEPTVGILEAENPIPEGSFRYVEFLYDWSRTSVFSPPIAFGEDSGGGQRSGITLEIRLWPMIKSLRRSRAYMTVGIQNALKKSAIILGQKKLEDIPVRALNSIQEDRIMVQYAPILPRDQAAAVDEVVKLSSTQPPHIDVWTAQDVLGRSSQVVDRVKDMVADDDLYREVELPMQGENSDNQNNLSDG